MPKTMESDYGRFIEEVRQRKSIWDNSIEENEIEVCNKTAWTEICNVIFPEFERVDDMTKSQILINLKGRWQALQQSYLCLVECKYHHECENTHVFARQLTFLKSAIPPTRPTEFSPNPELKEGYSGCEAHAETHDFNEGIKTMQKGCSSSTLPERTKYLWEHRQKKNRLHGNHVGNEFFDSLSLIINPLPFDKKLEFKLEATRLAHKFVKQFNEEFAARSQAPLPFPDPSVPTFPLETQNPIRQSITGATSNTYNPPISHHLAVPHIIPSSEQHAPVFQYAQHLKLPTDFYHPPVPPVQSIQHPKLPLEFYGGHPVIPYSNQHFIQPPHPLQFYNSGQVYQAKHIPVFPPRQYFPPNCVPVANFSQNPPLNLNNHSGNFLPPVELPSVNHQSHQNWGKQPVSPSKVFYAPKMKDTPISHESYEKSSPSNESQITFLPKNSEQNFDGGNSDISP